MGEYLNIKVWRIQLTLVKNYNISLFPLICQLDILWLSID